MFSLFKRFRNEGTLSEPDGISHPGFALQSMVNWMRAVALLVKEEGLDYGRATTLYSKVTKRQMTSRQENSVFEQLLLAIHHLAALRALEDVGVQADIARVAIVGWYYGIYSAASAMIAAQEGSIHDNHTDTAKVWDHQFVQRRQALHPFDLRLSTLERKVAERELDRMRKEEGNGLKREPRTPKDAHGAMCAYLSGTMKWRAQQIEQDVKKKNNLKDFREKAARALRDKRLRKESVSFLHQASRFRGKANYRDALYLAYGNKVEANISGFVSDMANVLESFSAMAGAFSFNCIGSVLRDKFLEDLDTNRSFSIDHRQMWS